MSSQTYSSIEEIKRILTLLLTLAPLPQEAKQTLKQVTFTAKQDFPYLPIPFKESEVASALKAIEASIACVLQDLKDDTHRPRKITISFEKTTAFLFQAYLARIGKHGKLDNEVKAYLKDTDLLRAQSDPYRRMSANLYETKHPQEYYHIHGSLEASTTLRMIGLEPFRPDLETHEQIVEAIESRVRQYTIDELEELNAKNKQAGSPVYPFRDFLLTPHGQANASLPPWTVNNLEMVTPPCRLHEDWDRPVLTGIKVLELCRIIAGPIIGRTLAEYGADVLKITSPNLSDVPFFQVDGNMGKHAANLDLKTIEGRKTFEKLVLDADIILDGYRPGALERLGYGSRFMSDMAKKRGYGIVYINENCFGWEGEWASRPGWQQIADCATGVAWEQGKFMGLNEPVVPPFPISDYGTGCIGAIAALTGLHRRATVGGSWHGFASLMHYDLLLFKAGLYPPEVQKRLRESAGHEFLAMRHSNSVDQISAAVLSGLKLRAPLFFNDANILETWHSQAYRADITVVKPVVDIEGLTVGFRRASRPNGTDDANWDFKDDEGDYLKDLEHV